MRSPASRNRCATERACLKAVSSRAAHSSEIHKTLTPSMRLPSSASASGRSFSKEENGLRVASASSRRERTALMRSRQDVNCCFGSWSGSGVFFPVSWHFPLSGLTPIHEGPRFPAASTPSLVRTSVCKDSIVPPYVPRRSTSITMTAAFCLCVSITY